MLILEKEVLCIINQVQEGVDWFKLLIIFEVGEQVCVFDGLFVFFFGLVEEVDDEWVCLKVVVFIFGWVILVELEFGQVDKF